MKIFLKTIQTSTIVALTVASLLLIFTTINFLGFQMFVVRSGSMEPDIKTGAIVFDIKSATYNEGDVITFKTDGTTVTHRITKVENGSYIVKGDANNTTDIDPVEKSQVVGKVAFSVPYLGFFVEFLRSLPGLIIFIVIPATIIIYEEFRTITKEVKNIRAKKLSKKDTPKAKIITSAFLLLAAFGLMVGNTSAYFSDSKVVTGNVFSTGYWGLIINEVYPNVAAQKGAEGKNDWVELYNPSTEPINLKGYAIVTKMGYFSITTNAVSVPARGYVLIAHDASTWKLWDIEKQTLTVNLPGNYNKPDWLIASSDYVYLKSPQGHTVDKVIFTDIPAGSSWARYENLWALDESPTPGAQNN